MINDQLLGYIKQQLSAKADRGAIVANLKSAGWSEADINEAFRTLSPAASPISPVAKPAIPMSPKVSPTASSPLTTAAFSPSPGTSPSHKSKKLVPAIVLLVFLGLAAGAALYAHFTGVFVTLPQLLLESMEKGKDVTSSKYDATFKIDFSGMEALSTVGPFAPELNFTVKGASEITDTDIESFAGLKNSSVFSVNMGPISFEAELRIVDETFFIRLTKLPVLPGMPTPDFAAYQNKWFSISFNDEAFSQQFSDHPNIMSSLTEEQKDHFFKMFKDARIIKQVEKLTPETISGEPSYHFSFDLDREGLVAYVETLKEYIKTIGKDDPDISALVSFDSAEFAKILDSVKDFKGEIWIGRKDKLIYKTMASFAVQPDLAKDEQVKMTMVVIFSDYNKPVSIVAPEESTPFETLMEASVKDVQ